MAVRALPRTLSLARRAAASLLPVVVVLAGCGDDDIAEPAPADSAASEQHALGAEVLPALLVEHAHLLGQASVAQVGQRADQRAALDSSLLANVGSVAAAVAPSAPQPVEAALAAHARAFAGYTDAAMTGDPTAKEAAAGVLVGTGEALLAAFEGADGGSDDVGTTTSIPAGAGTTDGGGTAGATEGGTGQGQAGTGQQQGGSGQAQGGGDEPDVGDEADQGDAVAGQGQADAGADQGDADASEAEASQDQGAPTEGVAGVVQQHAERMRQAIDALVAGDPQTATLLTVAATEDFERLAGQLSGTAPVDHGALELVGEHAEHPLAATAVTAALIGGRTAEHAAAVAGAEANTVALLEELQGVAGGDAEELQHLWEAHLEAYEAYATGAAAGDQMAMAGARPALAEYVDGVASLLERWTRGGLAAEAAATELRRHVDGTLQTIDAQVAGDHPTVYRLAHEGVLHFAAFGAQVAAALDEASRGG